MGKPYLVVVNAGPRNVVRPEHLGPEVDYLAIAWSEQSVTDGAFLVARETDSGRRKFMSAAALPGVREECLTRDAVAFLDDDLVPRGCTWTDVFRLHRETGLHVAQPALTEDSHISHAIVRRDPGCRWRETDFVEVMCPLLDRRAYRACEPLFREAGFGSWGLEGLWGSRLTCGVLDATPVHHGRPTSTALDVDGPWKDCPANPWNERDQFYARHGILYNAWAQRVLRRHPAQRQDGPSGPEPVGSPIACLVAYE